RQYSPTERSPCTKVRKVASSWRARYSALPRNWPSSATQACRAMPPWVLTRSCRSREMVPKIQDRATLSRRSHVTSRVSIDESTRTWSSRAKGEEDLVPPAAVGGGGGIEEDGYQGPDVLDASRLE